MGLNAVSGRSRRLGVLIFWGVLFAVPAAAGAHAEPADDGYLLGYVASWLEHVEQVSQQSVSVSVHQGVVTLTPHTKDAAARLEELMAGVASLPGVREVLRGALARAPAAAASPAERRWSSWLRWLRPAEGRKTIRFPIGDLFVPPLADQKQPRFHTTYQRYRLDFGTFNVASVGFGENFGLVRVPGEREGDGWQLGINGAVFALFNLDAPSKDLLNADYYLGFPLSWRRGHASARIRPFHLSSHLGDEYLLNPQPGPPVERINLSYEALELLGSWERRGLRVYGGGIRIFSSATPLGRDRAQLGVELRGHAFGPMRAQWIAGVDLEAWDETDWDRDLSCKAGVRFPGLYGGVRALQVLLEYYAGHVPHGQFYFLEVDYLGLGLAYAF